MTNEGGMAPWWHWESKLNITSNIIGCMLNLIFMPSTRLGLKLTAWLPIGLNVWYAACLPAWLVGCSSVVLKRLDKFVLHAIIKID